MDKTSEDEQMQFYEKIVSYISRHPEFVDELTKRMEDEEKGYASAASQSAQEKKRAAGIFSLDDEKINTISNEISSMLFDKDDNNKSILEKTVQDAFSSAVKSYLSKYV